jgi:hypothetical protein
MRQEPNIDPILQRLVDDVVPVLRPRTEDPSLRPHVETHAVSADAGTTANSISGETASDSNDNSNDDQTGTDRNASKGNQKKKRKRPTLLDPYYGLVEGSGRGNLNFSACLVRRSTFWPLKPCRCGPHPSS